ARCNGTNYYSSILARFSLSFSYGLRGLKILIDGLCGNYMMSEKHAYPLRILALVILSVLVGSCRAAPDAAPVDTTHQKRVMTVHDDARKAVSVKKLADAIETDSSADLEHHLRAISARGGPPLIRDNDVRLLIDGPATYSAMFVALEQAKKSIDLEIYIFEDDEVGHDLRDMLVKRAGDGLRVRVIYDSLGCLTTPREFFEVLVEAGAEVLEFNPVKGQPHKLNHRDHRKILIVDGYIGFTGGINISDVYSRGSASTGFRLMGSKSSQQEHARKEGWRDTQVQIRGPAAAELQRIFLETWNANSDSIARRDDLSLTQNSLAEISGSNPVLSTGNASSGPAGDKVVRIIASAPDDEHNVIYSDLLTAIQQARHSVHLTMAYFSPDRRTIRALKTTAERGVDVVLVLPGFSDVSLIFDAGRAHYTTLLKSGVKIYERQDALLHAKSAVIDGVWSTVGSSNMDMRSFLHNNELNAVVLGSEFGDAMEDMFAEDK